MARTRNGHPKLDRGWTIVFDRQLLADAKRAARHLFTLRGERVSSAELVRRGLRREVDEILNVIPEGNSTAPEGSHGAGSVASTPQEAA